MGYDFLLAPLGVCALMASAYAFIRLVENVIQNRRDAERIERRLKKAEDALPGRWIFDFSYKPPRMTFFNRRTIMGTGRVEWK